MGYHLGGLRALTLGLWKIEGVPGEGFAEFKIYKGESYFCTLFFEGWGESFTENNFCGFSTEEAHFWGLIYSSLVIRGVERGG